ncbi:hypothetical protein [Geodermatophilus sp. CPCC 205506]|uniref:hypothetical protein n=1 Tax=Geodermatophilus sp. CPCC 205506 TaxID=2936596 RepID=UPI003EEC6FB9
MSIKFVKRVTFLCPALLTGGPEAVHQAAQVLNQEGLPADIAYYGAGGGLRIDGSRLEVTPPAENPCLTEFAHYEPVVCRQALLRRHHLVVLPEVLALQAASIPGASVAVWWLSVDNGLLGVGEAARRSLFADRSVRHFHQSAYAEDFLRGVGVPASYPLGDFTDPRFTAVPSTGPNPEPAVAYNPAKGADLAAAFFGGSPGLRAAPIQGMSKPQIVDLLRSTMVYVDFGHLPGKDRLPREAAASGAVVFVRRLGAGRFAGDFPVPDFFRFDEADVHSGELARRVAAVQAEPGRFWAEQEPFRARISGEREELREQVRRLRGQRQAA